MEIGFCLPKEFLSLLLNCRLCEPWRLTQNDTEDLIFKANKNPNGISDVIPRNWQVLRMFREKEEAQLLYFNLVLFFSGIYGGKLCHLLSIPGTDRS